LLKNITENHTYQDAISFFECGRIWKKQKNEPVEQHAIAGIFFKKRSAVDFYQCKRHLTDLFAALGFDRHVITWHKEEKQPSAWYRPYQTATLMYNKNQAIGVAGKADPIMLNKLDIDAPCDAFIFELNGNFLLSQSSPTKIYKPLSKFQENYFDVSLFVPRKLETATIEQCIQNSNPLIKSVDLIDIFEKDSSAQDTNDVRALTFRTWIGLAEKTMEKAEIDTIRQHVIAVLEKLGAKVRM
jgi:phenylalanyl-tRNA synthetase beta subunit